MMRKKTVSALLLTSLLMACVTINIYFPAAAAEKAADRIIEEVWGKQPENGDKKPAPTSKDMGIPWRVVNVLLTLVATPAYAGEADIDVSSPAIRKITATMEARHGRLAPYYHSGAIGLATNALIVVRALQGVPLKDRNTLKKLVADENADRNALYREIARANGHPEWEQDIRATFARRWVAKAQAGWWYMNAGGKWKRK